MTPEPWYYQLLHSPIDNPSAWQEIIVLVILIACLAVALALAWRLKHDWDRMVIIARLYEGINDGLRKENTRLRHALGAVPGWMLPNLPDMDRVRIDFLAQKESASDEKPQ